MSARALALSQSGAGAWLGAIGAGAALGGVVVTGMWLDAWQPLRAAAFEAALAVHERVGPVWVPMALVAARVAWLAARTPRWPRLRLLGPRQGWQLIREAKDATVDGVLEGSYSRSWVLVAGAIGGERGAGLLGNHDPARSF